MTRRTLAIVLGLTFFFAPAALAGGIITEMTDTMYRSYEAQAVKWRDLLGGEASFYPAFCGAGVQGGRYVVLFRFQPIGTKPVNFFGRHFSVIFDNKGNLVGMLRMRPEWAVAAPPSTSRAEATAALFIRRHVPALWRFIKSQKVEIREFPIMREDGSEASVSGVLSTFYDHKRNTVFFVMVAPDGSVMAFERDLPNAEVDFGRSVENWLYDAYLHKALNCVAPGK